VTARKVDYDAIAQTVREKGKLTFGEIAARWNLSPSTAYAVLKIIPEAYPDIKRVGDTLMASGSHDEPMASGSHETVMTFWRL
jgi:hypothetical protein